MAPPHQIRPFRGPEDTIRTMVGLVKGQRGEHSVYLRSLTEQVVRGLQDKDYLGEIIAVRNFVAERVRYMNDPLTLELVKDPQRLAEEISARGRAVGDCFPEGTMVVRRGISRAESVPIEEIKLGDKIWGLNDWTTVEAVAWKGPLSVLSVPLHGTIRGGSQGGPLLLTADHKVYAWKCKQHDFDERNLAMRALGEEIACFCPLAGRVEERVRVRDLIPGMLLSQPGRKPGHFNQDPDYPAYPNAIAVSDTPRAFSTFPCWDIQTSDHRVWLPEHDVTVSNCDDIASISAAMFRQLGREAQFVTVGFNRPNHYSHVFTRVKEPKSQRWYVSDPVAGSDEGTMLRRVKTYRVWTID